MKTAVIGGGIAGLVAAYELLKAGKRPIVIEPADVGGMIRSVSKDGFTLELGPNVLVERPDIVMLLSELGLSGEISYPSVERYGQYVWWRGSARKVPASLAEFIFSPIFSTFTKLMLPFRLLIPRLLKPNADDLSVLSFFSPLIGEQAVKALLDPVLKGIYGGDVEKLSARSIFSGLWAAAAQGSSILGYMRRRSGGRKPRIMVIKGGIQRITEALGRKVAERVEILTTRAVALHECSPRGFNIRCADGSAVEVDSCVITTAGQNLVPLLSDLSPSTADMLKEQQYASLGVVHLAAPRSEPLIKDAFGVLFPGGMPEDLLGVMFNSLIFPHVAPQDAHILTVIVGGAQAGSKDFDEARLRERLPTLVSELLGVSTLEWMYFTRWVAAIPQLNVGHYRVTESLDKIEGEHPGVVFAGVDRGGVGVSDRVRIAREAVQRAIAAEKK